MQDRVDGRFLKVGNMDLSTLRALNTEELIGLENEMANHCDGIEMALASARARRIRDGVFADADWYQRAEVALKIKRRQSMMIQQEKKRRKSLDGAAQNNSRERAFIAICARDLDADDLKDMWAEADAICRGELQWPGGGISRTETHLA